jgi:hypothetical protein
LNVISTPGEKTAPNEPQVLLPDSPAQDTIAAATTTKKNKILIGNNERKKENSPLQLTQTATRQRQTRRKRKMKMSYQMRMRCPSEVIKRESMKKLKEIKSICKVWDCLTWFKTLKKTMHVAQERRRQIR